MRRLRLPKLGPPTTKGFFEEYFYACLAVLFLSLVILCWAGGLGGFNAVVSGAWVAGAVWSGWLLKSYLQEKEKTREAGSGTGTAANVPEAGPAKAVLPPGMKPMIGIQWPVKSGAWPRRPGLKTAPSIPAPTDRPPTASAPPPSTPTTPTVVPTPAGNATDKPGFRYERPTLPDRKTKLPRNWPGSKDNKPKR